MKNKKMKKFQEDVEEFYSYLNLIEKNLSLSSTEIIKRILKQYNLLRTTLDRKFKKLYSPNNEYHYKNLAKDEYIVVIKRLELCK